MVGKVGSSESDAGKALDSSSGSVAQDVSAVKAMSKS